MKENLRRPGSFFAANWLCCLIAAQPLLDALAYWNRNSVATAAGYIRLIIMAALPVVLLIRLEKKRAFALSLAVIGAYSALHVLNGFRVGYISLYFDAAYLAKVVQMPVLAVCFVSCIRDGRMKDQAVRGVLAAGALTLALLALACLTGTANATYGEGLGVSGWVIDDNRCANSIIFVTLSCFGMYWALKSEKRYINLLVPSLIAFVLIINGTKACYAGLFALLIAYGVFLLLEKPVLKKPLRKVPLLVLALLIAVSAAVYPISPRAKVDAALAQTSGGKQGEIEATAAQRGYDVAAMTPEERLGTPEVREIFEYYYYRYMVGVIPDIFDRFGFEAVLRYFDMTTDVAELIDTRNIKLAYSALLFDRADALTKLVGFEVTEIGTDGTRDLENDWPAILYYYGYIGLALYVSFVLYFIYLALRRLAEDFKGSFTLFNFCLLLCLMLQIGLAQFSGAILRRPNVSIYMAVVLALIYFQTRRVPVGREGGI